MGRLVVKVKQAEEEQEQQLWRSVPENEGSYKRPKVSKCPGSRVV